MTLRNATPHFAPLGRRILLLSPEMIRFSDPVIDNRMMFFVIVSPNSLKVLYCWLSLLCHFSSFWNAEDEACTFVVVGVEPNLAAKELDDGFADGESQSSELDVVA